jgi:hypothetical protein
LIILLGVIALVLVLTLLVRRVRRRVQDATTGDVDVATVSPALVPDTDQSNAAPMQRTFYAPEPIWGGRLRDSGNRSRPATRRGMFRG